MNVIENVKLTARLADYLTGEYDAELSRLRLGELVAAVESGSEQVNLSTERGSERDPLSLQVRKHDGLWWVGCEWEDFSAAWFATLEQRFAGALIGGDGNDN